jgi:hypothetical protein
VFTVELLLGEIGREGKGAIGCRRIVEGRIQPSMGRDGLSQQPRDLLGSGNIGLNETGFPSLLPDALRDLLALLRAASGENDLGPRAGQGLCGRASYAGAAAGDENYPAPK